MHFQCIIYEHTLYVLNNASSVLCKYSANIWHTHCKNLNVQIWCTEHCAFVKTARFYDAEIFVFLNWISPPRAVWTDVCKLECSTSFIGHGVSYFKIRKLQESIQSSILLHYTSQGIFLYWTFCYVSFYCSDGMFKIKKIFQTSYYSAHTSVVTEWMCDCKCIVWPPFVFNHFFPFLFPFSLSAKSKLVVFLLLFHSLACGWEMVDFSCNVCKVIWWFTKVLEVLCILSCAS